MSNSLGVLTEKLNPGGQQRLFQFLELVDTDTAARFRSWLSTAPENQVGAAADMLNRGTHGREFANWWHSHDKDPAPAMAPSPSPPHPHPHAQHSIEHTRSHGPHSGSRPHSGTRPHSGSPSHSGAPPRGTNNDLAIGGAWLLGGLLITAISYTIAASGPGGGTYVVASGAMIYGVIRFLRGLKSG